MFGTVIESIISVLIKMKYSNKYKKVVFIDDDKGLADLYHKSLRKKQLSEQLTFFDNAKDGIHYLKDAKADEMPDYILLDLYMPEMSGFEFLEKVEKLKNIKNSVEVYVCSSSKREVDRKRVMKFPFVSAYMEKPLESAFLEYLITDQI